MLNFAGSSSSCDWLKLELGVNEMSSKPLEVAGGLYDSALQNVVENRHHFPHRKYIEFLERKQRLWSNFF